LNALYPPACHFCGAALPSDEVDFCADCTLLLTADPWTTCPRCAATVGPHTHLAEGCPRCRDEPFAFSGVLRLGKYAGPLQEAVLRMKKPLGEDLAHALGRLWAERAFEKLAALRADVVVPIPLHWLRRFHRGYNQAETLARALAKKLAIPCKPRWLRRIRHTPMQPRQSATGRRANVQGALKASFWADVRGKTVLIVDDVLTTGSTCNEAARALKRAGAARIVVAVLSRSEN
jgi:ComF family protein